MNKVLCFGEILLRFSPPVNGFDRNAMPFFLGGAELNTAVGLARWGVPVACLTALPDHFLAENIKKDMDGLGIDTSRISISGHRVGTYYLPEGSDLKSGKVVYDRMHSSFADMKAEDLDWAKVFDGISWFHFSAITPALSPSLATLCLRAVVKASELGIPVSVDLNYREKLWRYGKRPMDVMPEIVRHCDFVMGNLWAAEKMLGIDLPETKMVSKDDHMELAEICSARLFQTFPKCSQVTNTFRFEDADGIRYYGTLYDGRKLFASKEHAAQQVIDRVGSGDSFMAGFIYGNIMGLNPQKIIDFAAAAAFRKLFVKGDASTASLDDVWATANH